MLRKQSIRPPADPAGKGITVFLTSVGLATKVSCSSGAARKVEHGCAGGCLLLSWIRELSSGMHKDSAELAKRTAPLKSPLQAWLKT